MAETSTQTRRSSICLVRWWFGEFPPCFDCFLRSCAANPDIDWLLLTDNSSRKNLPPNVRTHPLTFDELRRSFGQRLGVEANIPSQGLLTKFRPAIGLLHEELLRNYDFWGYCDLDVVFGDLRKFLREDILANHDKIFSRGHLTLYRNTEKINHAFMMDCPNALNWRDSFTSGRVEQFDEMRGINLIFRYHNLPHYRDDHSIVDVKIPTRWKITRFEGTAIRNYPEQVFYWHNGKIFHAHHNCDGDLVDDEYAYLHFQKRPMPGPSFDPFSVPGFLITPDGFFPYNREPLTADDFARYNRERWRPGNELVKGFFQSLAWHLGMGR